MDETRPRNQVALLTYWELKQNRASHRPIVDNAEGHLIQRYMVELVIVGSGRKTLAKDLCNKIGTYLKAVVARESRIPFYAAMPISTIDPLDCNKRQLIVVTSVRTQSM